MTHKYKIELTLTTRTNHGKHALNRLKVAVREYNEKHSLPQSMELTDATYAEVKPLYRAGMGSLFRKNSILYALVSCGMGGGGYVVTRLKDGCWAQSGSDLRSLVENMLEKGTYTLVKTCDYGGITWTGDVELEEIKL